MLRLEFIWIPNFQKKVDWIQLPRSLWPVPWAPPVSPEPVILIFPAQLRVSEESARTAAEEHISNVRLRREVYPMGKFFVPLGKGNNDMSVCAEVPRGSDTSTLKNIWRPAWCFFVGSIGNDYDGGGVGCIPEIIAVDIETGQVITHLYAGFSTQWK